MMQNYSNSSYSNGMQWATLYHAEKASTINVAVKTGPIWRKLKAGYLISLYANGWRGLDNIPEECVVYD